MATACPAKHVRRIWLCRFFGPGHAGRLGGPLLGAPPRPKTHPPVPIGIQRAERPREPHVPLLRVAPHAGRVVAHGTTSHEALVSYLYARLAGPLRRASDWGRVRARARDEL